jgi:hypothetical protein
MRQASFSIQHIPNSVVFANPTSFSYDIAGSSMATARLGDRWRGQRLSS